MKDRYGFNVRAFVEQHGLDGSKGGAHMFREIWDPVVSSIYENTLSMFMHHLVLLLLTCHFLLFTVACFQDWQSQNSADRRKRILMLATESDTYCSIIISI